ncbi:MAG: beta-galactosidase [Miltoncostaeaceae bacterium]|nr:beta-galactosidase [Miltoncostaeaceae bacterium]
MMGRLVRRRLLIAAGLATWLAGAGAAAAQVPVAPDRPAGAVFDWSHELNQNELPIWDPDHAPAIPPRRWYRTIDGILRAAGDNGLWFTGVSALPFPPLPLHPREPVGWRTHARFSRAFTETGLKWDVNLEVWPARHALDHGAPVNNPRTEAHTRRLSLLHPAYRREALKEIRRLVPRFRGRPYVHAYTGSDEPMVFLPTGRRAAASAFAKKQTREVRRDFGWAPPRWDAPRTTDPREGLRWLAWSRYVGDRLFDMKAEQTALIRRLDPKAVVIPNDFGFIDGLMPWDYTRLAGFADEVEADPYVSFAEKGRAGRGRYNPGFGAKLLSDLTGKPVRIVVQAFPYAGYRPRSGDLWTWAAQALRAGATELSFFASQNPRFTDRPIYRTMLGIARSLRGTRLPAAPTDPAQLVLYATASEGQAQPHRAGGARYRSSADELYTLYSLLGELNGGAFSFDADARLAREPDRLARARTIWLPRADTLDRPVAEALRAWVEAGGTLVVTDPDAFTRAPDASSLADVREALIGAPLGEGRDGGPLLVAPSALAAGEPAETLVLPVATDGARPFASVPAGARVVAAFRDGAPAAILRPVGAGRVLAFASETLAPSAAARPADLARFVGMVHRWAGGVTGDPAWTYRIPGDPDPTRPPWRGAAESVAIPSG